MHLNRLWCITRGEERLRSVRPPPVLAAIKSGHVDDCNPYRHWSQSNNCRFGRRRKLVDQVHNTPKSDLPKPLSN